jgi:superfamily II DNA or RNA helicase
MLKKSLLQRAKTITFQQIDAHMCKAIGSDHGLMELWNILSYEKAVRMRGKKLKIEIMVCSYLDRRNDKFPYGLVKYATEKMNELGYEIIIQELKFNKKLVLFPKLKGITFEDYQTRILKLAGKEKRGIFVAGTGSGKTVVAGGIISKFNQPVSLFVTINKTIFRQTIKDFREWFPDTEIGIVGDKECSVEHITVALYQSLSKWDLRKYNEILELIIIDEAHSAGKSINKVMRQLTNVHLRFGVTATPQDEDTDKQKFLEMTGNIGSVITEISDDDVKARVTDVEVHIVKYLCINPKGYDYRTSYKKDILFSKVRNTKLLKKAKGLALDKGLTCLFMVKEIGHAEEISKIAKGMGLKPYIVHSEKDEDENERIRAKLEKKKISLVIATQKWGTGTNIHNIDCVIPASVRKSFIELIQNIGRGRRRTATKDTLIVIDSLDLLRPDENKKFYDKFNEYSQHRISIYKKKGWLK